MLNRRLLRRCQSISESHEPSLKGSFKKGSFKKPSDLGSLRKKLSQMKNCFLKFNNILNESESHLRVLTKDMIQILSNKNIEKKNSKRIIENLLEVNINENLKIFEKDLQHLLSQSVLKNLVTLDSPIFPNSPSTQLTNLNPVNNLKTKEKTKDISECLEKPEIPNLMKSPKLNKHFQSVKNIEKGSPGMKKVKRVNARALEELMDQRGFEVKGLRDILQKSKKGFKDFLRSFGWSENEIEDAMRTASVKDSPEKKVFPSIKKCLNERFKQPRKEDMDEYQIQSDMTEKLKNTHSKNIVIKEYLADESTERRSKICTQTDFHSKKTNYIKMAERKELEKRSARSRAPQGKYSFVFFLLDNYNSMQRLFF